MSDTLFAPLEVQDDLAKLEELLKQIDEINEIGWLLANRISHFGSDLKWSTRRLRSADVTWTAAAPDSEKVAA